MISLWEVRTAVSVVQAHWRVLVVVWGGHVVLVFVSCTNSMFCEIGCVFRYDSFVCTYGRIVVELVSTRGRFTVMSAFRFFDRVLGENEIRSSSSYAPGDGFFRGVFFFAVQV